jgi:calcineurin-like phosphoesterase family protein
MAKIHQKIYQLIQDLWGKKRIYLIGDTHFDHANIIRYCERPFSNVRVMNRVLVKNWNNTVKPKDTVYFLGDWAFGRHYRPPKHWIKKLNGHIISIKGSHDREKFRKSTVLFHNGYRFLLIHNPSDKSKNWKGWVIHGHKHNNNMRDYPFINGQRKTINVGVELINYRPVSLDFLLSLNIDSIKRMATINSKPERWETKGGKKNNRSINIGN